MTSNLVRRLDNRSISLTTRLYSVAINARGSCSREPSLTSLLSAIVVDIFDVERVDMAWEIPRIGLFSL